MIRLTFYKEFIMAGTTTKGFRYPTASDAPAIHTAFLNLASDVDSFLDTPQVTTSIIFEGSTADAFETTLTVVDPTADRTVTIPDVTTTLVGTDATQTLTNKTIDTASNTITGAVTLTGTQTVTNKTLNLTSNTLVTTLAQLNSSVSDADVVSLAGAETLTNKTLTSPVISSITNGAATLTLPVSTGTVALTSQIVAVETTENFARTTALLFGGM
jgi:hypothetical protein